MRILASRTGQANSPRPPTQRRLTLRGERDDDWRKLGPGWRAVRRFQEWERLQAMTQRELADQLGVRQPTISRLLSGQAPLSAKLYDAVARLMRIDVGQLIGTEDASMWNPKEADLMIALHQLDQEERKEIMEQIELQIEHVLRRRRERAAAERATTKGNGGAMPKRTHQRR